MSPKSDHQIQLTHVHHVQQITIKSHQINENHPSTRPNVKNLGQIDLPEAAAPTSPKLQGRRIPNIKVKQGQPHGG